MILPNPPDTIMTVTINGEDFTLTISDIGTGETFIGTATDKRDDIVATAVSGHPQTVRKLLCRKLRRITS